jgi:hypothetical protein
MADATGITVVQDGGQQFQGVYARTWTVRATINVDSLAAAASDTDNVTVPGVALGDMVSNISLGVSQAGVICTGYISAANTVTLVFTNTTAAPVDLAATTVRLVVVRPSF